MKKFDVLFRNYNIESKKYQFGTQIIKSLSNEEFIKLIEEIPKPDKDKPIQIEIVTEDLILQKSEDGNLQYKYNRIIPYMIKQKFKGKLKSSELKDFNKKKIELLKIIIPSIIFIIFNMIMLYYFLFLYMGVLSIFIEINFGNIIIRLFLLWALLFPILGIIISIKELLNILIQRFLIPFLHLNPTKNIIEKNSIIKTIIFFWQVIYLLVYLFLYFPNTNLHLIYDRFIIYLVLVCLSISFGIYFLIGNFILLKLNRARKEDVLNFLYYEIQNPKVPVNIQNYYIKIINDIESAKIIKFDITLKLISLFSILIAILPNILNF